MRSFYPLSREIKEKARSRALLQTFAFADEWDGGRVIVSLVALQRTALRLKLKH